ncbi:MAG: LamG domain-containing protein, partial [Gammaproteobacteria bacterium]|nr:LamG domain-containing protein [Gammaproteobacteria bacterium]
FLSGTAATSMMPEPHNSKFQYSNVYEENPYLNAGLTSDYGSGSRDSNLKADFDRGVTIEFWLQTGSMPGLTTQKQVVFDMWNGAASSSADYGRITLMITGSEHSVSPLWTDSPFRLTVQSGSSGDNTGSFEQQIGTNIEASDMSSWHHYAISLQNTGSQMSIAFYIDGALNQTQLLGGGEIGELNPRGMRGRVGALLVAPSGSFAEGDTDGSELAGAGKLSGSIDEFRYWKAKRTGHDIGRNWINQVGGGVNTDIANTELGVYYKFNEGITGDSTVDGTVLDYGGRICNGRWQGYTANSRNTGSAIVSASAAPYERLDPVIRPEHPDIISLRSNLLSTGSTHDRQNNNLFINYMPSWIQDEYEPDDAYNGDLSLMSHVIGSYFDTMYQQVRALPSFVKASYTSGSHKPVPFAQHLPQSLGLDTPELFVDSSIIEQFLNRDDKTLFEGDLTETKNLIYLNLYNNLAHIFKSKGTERAVRNTLRCFNINDDVFKLNVYNRNHTFELRNNLRQTLSEETRANFGNTNNLEGVIYQRISSSNPNSRGYISGSGPSVAGAGPYVGTRERKYGFTLEADVIFPNYESESDPIVRNYLTSSLFGMYTVNTASVDDIETEEVFLDFDPSNLQVRAIRTKENSKDVYFQLDSANSPWPLKTISAETKLLTSSVFYDVYDNERWNFSVRIKPTKDFADIVTGALSPSSYGYDVIFRGINTFLGEVKNSFELTGEISFQSGSDLLQNSKRVYCGAERTNYTGTLLHKSDVQVNSVKYWAKHIDNHSLDQHLYDASNQGISGSYQNVKFWDPNNGPMDVLNTNALALSWNFNNITGGSNAAGNFYTEDNSSGSAMLRTANYGWFGGKTGWQHTGYGYGFATSSTAVYVKDPINSFKFVNPERAVSNDMIQILSDDDEVLGIVETVPSYYYTLEKSLYGALSEEMLDFLAGVVDFNNVIGAPVNRYRSRYKNLEKLRESFFRRVNKVSSVEKYINYYKWFDGSISTIIEQMLPASADFEAEVFNTIESHVLERNKYQTPFPTYEFVESNLDSTMEGLQSNTWDWQSGHSMEPSSPRRTDVNEPFVKQRMLRTSIELTSGDPDIDGQRENIRKIAFSQPTLSSSANVRYTPAGVGYSAQQFRRRALSAPYEMTIELSDNKSNIHGGVNFPPNKNIQFTYDALYPFGPLGTDPVVPLNVLFTQESDIVELAELYLADFNPKGKTIERSFKVHFGREWEDGLGGKNLKSSTAYPFSIVSSSVTTGYNKDVVNGLTGGIQITNLHNDVYGTDMEKPMQGPFTEYAVGGHQHRHTRINKGADNYKTRAEAWKLLVGECGGAPTGSMGLVAPDYPWPDIGQDPAAAEGTVSLAWNVTSSDSVTIGDGDTTKTFEVPFENEKSVLFTNSANSWIAVSGDKSSSYGLPSDHPLDFYYLEKATISAWVSASATDKNAYIFQAGAPNGAIDVAIRTDNTVRLTQAWYRPAGGPYNVNAFWDTDAAVITTGKWHHIAVTYDATLSASQDPKFFIDGVLVDSSAGTAVPADSDTKLQLKRIVDRESTTKVITTIGGYNVNVPFSGSIDEMSIWQLSMSAEQITEVYATGSVQNLFKVSAYVSDSTNLYSWWRMGDDANDAVDGGGSYSLGVNSIVDQTGRANGNPGSEQSFSTSVVTASAGSNVTWTKGPNYLSSVQNLKDAINEQYTLGTLSVTASALSGTTAVNLNNTLYGDADSTHIYINGAFGNISSSKSGDSISVSGMAGGRNPTILNYNAPRATYYRDQVAKRPVNIRNIELKTGSTIIGNYRHRYEFVQTVGAWENPRAFVDHQPTLPSIINDNNNLTGSGIAGNFLLINRTSASHFDYGLTYAPTQLTGSKNKTVMTSRFSAPGSRETFQRGLKDIRSAEFSPYNTIPYKNQTVIKNSQGAGAGGDEDISAEIIGGIQTSGYRMSDIHGKDFGLRALLSRPSARFGRDMLFAGSDPGAVYSQAPSFQKNQRNTKITVQTDDDGGFDELKKYDNFFVTHQIPRMDRQYAWVTNSLSVHTPVLHGGARYYGMAPVHGDHAGYYVDKTNPSYTYEPYFSYVSESDVRPLTTRHPALTFAEGGLVQVHSNLNIYTLDAVTASQNYLGFPLEQPPLPAAAAGLFLTSRNSNYINDAKNGDLLTQEGIAQSEITASANYLNLVLTRRGSNYGWNWTATHQQDHPILRAEKNTNKISVITGSDNGIDRYRLSPVSMRGRPVYINYSNGDEDITLKATHNNEEIFFNDTAFNNLLGLSPENITTPYEQIVNAIQPSLNWVQYSENIFPSLRNEFATKSLDKPTYDNKYWRNSRTERTTVGTSFNNSWNVPRRGDIAGNPVTLKKGVIINQSSWPLDAQESFLTRSTLPYYSSSANDDQTFRQQRVGELQNNYGPYKPGYGFATNHEQRNMISPSAKYSRKHLLQGAKTVTGPNGTHINETGSAVGMSFANFQVGAGEALWETGDQAGILVKNDEGGFTFEASASQPWYNSYEDYRQDLKVLAKDFSVIPEFRISEHIEDYVKYGIFTPNKTDTFELPETGINSSTSSFYKDYSNSDFMSGFLKVSKDTLLDAKEISLVCSAAIKFNPYKGFYPVQRTMDLSSQFSSSYADGFSGFLTASQNGIPFLNTKPWQKLLTGSTAVNGITPFIAPGILFNSIKAGMAVDYPIVTDGSKLLSVDIGCRAEVDSTPTKTPFELGQGDNHTFVLYGSASDDSTRSAAFQARGWNGSGSIWDKRIPFEAIIEPEVYLQGTSFVSQEAHPSASSAVVTSWNGKLGGETTYTRMARNFFGEVGSFFLKDKGFTRLESQTISDDLRFPSGSVYGARIKLHRSTRGPRTYSSEDYPQVASGSWPDASSSIHSPWAAYGGRKWDPSSSMNASASAAPTYGIWASGSFPVPQDPIHNPNFEESFTLYSRPSAFFPPCGGRPPIYLWSEPTASLPTWPAINNMVPEDSMVFHQGAMGSTIGMNPAGTPPYYDGEAWVDLIFRPSHTKSYDLEQILAETEMVYWRFDAGYAGTNLNWDDSCTERLAGYLNQGPTTLIPTYNNNFFCAKGSSNFYAGIPIYDGVHINANSMQASASLNLLGVEKVKFEEIDKFGNLGSTRNITEGKKWVIQPKFETPHMNFNYKGDRGINSGSSTITVPQNFSASVPRGMWHQFGTIPTDPSTGIFMEIGDIPEEWLKNHYMVINQPSPYNDHNISKGIFLSHNMKSLATLAGFDQTKSRARLGELAESRTIREAVVAVPYIVDYQKDATGETGKQRKRFISIPPERYSAATNEQVGSKSGDSLDASGESIRKLVQKMPRYVMPPQFDFISNDNVDPLVMYIFEFEYNFDKDDLSYMWQNIAPRDYRKVDMQFQSVAHELMDTELLSERNLTESENLRWMVFKVKQKAQTGYYDQVVRQAGQASDQFENKKLTDKDDVGYQLNYNWPYDYLSFVELVKIDAEVLYKKPDKKDES